ncbi:MAG: hypothetical protein ACJAZ3_000492 [Sphingobacteriales bacterium]|jgi:hypothetical protein
MDAHEVADNARVWVYQSNRKFEDKEVESISKELQSFVSEWTAHNQQLHGLSKVMYNHFLVLIVDESKAQASGCSIDKSIKVIQEIEQKYDLKLFNRTDISYRDEKGEIQIIDINQFKELGKSGVVNSDTIVFNNLVTDYLGFKTKWEVPVSLSWHQNFFFSNQLA